MKTRFIGTKELRQNMSKIADYALKKKEKLIVMRKNEPIFELRPLGSSEALAESFYKDIKEAREDIKSKNTNSQTEVEKMFGL